MPVETVEESLRAEITVIKEKSLIVISSQESYNQATTLLLEKVVPFRKRWKEYWDKPKKLAWEAYQAIQSKFKEGDEPLEMAERTLKHAIRVWDDEQTRIEQERQRKAQEEAERHADEERLQAAIVAEQSGATQQEVEAIVDSPVAVVAEPVPPAYQRTSGISTRRTWKCKVNDLHALVKAAAKDKSLLPYLLANEKALNARASADQSTMNIPGCLAYQESSITARTR